MLHVFRVPKIQPFLHKPKVSLIGISFTYAIDILDTIHFHRRMSIHLRWIDHLLGVSILKQALNPDVLGHSVLEIISQKRPLFYRYPQKNRQQNTQLSDNNT